VTAFQAATTPAVCKTIFKGRHARFSPTRWPREGESQNANRPYMLSL